MYVCVLVRLSRLCGVKNDKKTTIICCSDPLRTTSLSKLAAIAVAAASVCVCLAGGVPGGLSVLALMVVLTVVTVVVLLLNGSFQPVLHLTGVLMSSAGITQPSPGLVVTTTGVLMTLLLSNIDMVLLACYLGITEVSVG